MRDTQFGLGLLDGFFVGFDRGFACALTPRPASAGGFTQRLAPSNVDETEGFSPSAVFGASPPMTCPPLPDRHPSPLRCSPHSLSGRGRTSELPWGPNSFELDLACLAALLGKIMMSQDVRFSWLFGKVDVRWYWLYQLPRGIAKFYLPQEVLFSFGVRGKSCLYVAGKVPYLALGYLSCSCSMLRETDAKGTVEFYERFQQVSTSYLIPLMPFNAICLWNNYEGLFPPGHGTEAYAECCAAVLEVLPRLLPLTHTEVAALVSAVSNASRNGYDLLWRVLELFVPGFDPTVPIAQPAWS
jgi:hypothetical protein